MASSRTLSPVVRSFCVVLCAYQAAFAVQDSTAAAAKDTTNRAIRDTLRQKLPDSLAIAKLIPDSVAAPDTLGRMSTPSLVGTLDRSLDSVHVFTKDQLNWIDYRYLGGVLEHVPGAFVREQNAPGQYSQISFRGADWRNVAVLMNGRLMNDPASGVFNLFYFNTEYADRVEVITGPRAFLHGLNSAAGAINLVTKNYNSNRPFSKINYSETANNYQYSDGTFSQNVSRKVNVTFGFQHQGWDIRFANSRSDAWNIRGKLRYNLSRDFNIILSEYFTNAATDLNGGVKLSDPRRVTVSDFDPLQSDVVNPDAYEKVTRHDVDLSLIGTLLGDTTNVSMLTVYYSHALREYRDEEDRVSRNNQPPNRVFVQSDHQTSWMGALFTQDFHTEFQRLNVGGTVEIRQIEGSPDLGRRRNAIAAAWGKEEFLLHERLSIAGFGRIDQYRKSSRLHFGADANVKLVDGVSCYAGFSFSHRFPTYQELFWNDSTVTRTGEIIAEKHRTLELGVHLSLQEFLSARVAYFHRTISDPILITQTTAEGAFPHLNFANGGKRITNGIEAGLTGRIWLLYYEGAFTYMAQSDQSGSSLSVYPKMWANGGLYFWNKLLNDRLDLKAGFKARYLASSQGEIFNPEVVAYAAHEGPRVGFGSAVDFFLIAAIGNAHVSLMWENLTDIKYFVTPYYPVLNRAVKLAVRWQFLD